MNVMDILAFLAFTGNTGITFYKLYSLMLSAKKDKDELTRAKAISMITMGISLLCWLLMLGHLVTISTAETIAYLKMSTLLFNISTFMMVFNGLLTAIEVLTYFGGGLATTQLADNRRAKHYQKP